MDNITFIDDYDDYQIRHARHGCYEVRLVDETAEPTSYRYLTNFKNMRAAKKFIKEYSAGNVTIDPDTRVPTPDFK